MKRFLAVLFAACMILSLAGCITVTEGDSELQEPKNVETRAETQPENDKTEAFTTEATEQVTDSTSAPVAESTDTAVDPFADIVILDEAGIKVTTKGYDPQGSWYGPEVKLLIENNSGKSLTFQCRNASVNGYMVDTMMSVNVADGKKANDSITFSVDSILRCGIEAVADIEFSLIVFDTDSFDTYLESPPISLKSANADKYNYVFDDSGTLVYDENGIKIVVKGLESSGYGDQSVVVYIENNTQNVITVQARDVSVNGFMISPIFSTTVSAGKHAISDVNFMSYALEENDIESIENVELYFTVFDDETYNNICDTDVINIDF